MKGAIGYMDRNDLTILIRKAAKQNRKVQKKWRKKLRKRMQR